MGSRVILAPSRDVEPRGTGFIALSNEPWLTIDAPELSAGGHFVEITYRASFWDEPVRPVFRFETSDGGTIERIAAGAIAGSGQWIGRIPHDTIGVSVSPTNRLGPFDFAIESIRRRAWLGLLVDGGRRNPRSTRSAILTRLIGWKPESDINLAWAIGSIKLRDYAEWRATRHRALDLDGYDRPRFDWNIAPPIALWIDATRGAGGLDSTLDSLAAQVFQNWTALVVSPRPLTLPADPRIVQVHAVEDLPDHDGLVGSLQPHDRLLPHALGCICEASHRNPDHLLFYGDEEVETLDGPQPVFKPGWSALLQRQRPYLGRAVFVRGSLLATSRERGAFCATSAIPDCVIGERGRIPVLPLRRILLRTREAALETRLTREITPFGIDAPDCAVTIVIPTKDQPTRLRRAIAGIRRFSGSREVHIEIVDNGSIEPSTKALFDQLALDPDVRVRSRPGPFNFSAMCNEGAADSTAEVLVFLNDDTEALSSDWLDRICFWALRPGVGAVGAKLIYPDGRLQHIGVVVGMGESAGHFGAFADPNSPGWAGRAISVHEVSAVTGACLAVARATFEAVGGFDAANVPVELSDIDLCLRLAERGLTSIIDPAINLLHEEGASRGGATLRRLNVYQKERSYFTKRWRGVLRDDPYFHPGLSLFSCTPSLA